MTLTSSHDTKRSEDARMRIAAITHAPDAFLAFFRMVQNEPGEVGPNLRWYLAQTLVAMAGEADLADRLETHVEKALREAKRATFWSAPNAEVEDAARAFARGLAARFDPLPDCLAPVLARAEALILVQAALKLTLPGIPDVYQGCEIAAFALTDPDNRRPVDFDALAAGLGGATRLSRDLDRRKLALTSRLLRLRRAEPALFLYGSHEGNPDGIGFTRRHGTGALHVDARIDGGDVAPRAGEAVWPDAAEEPAPVRITLTR
jgi:(1->4)-alpha-D-glucan 1-alpha-D-glucosylmutase